MDDRDTNEFANVLGYDRRRRSLYTMRSKMFTSTEDDQEERYGQGTSNKVLGDLDTERGGDAPEEADRGAGPLEQFPAAQSSDLIRPITE